VSGGSCDGWGKSVTWVPKAQEQGWLFSFLLASKLFVYDQQHVWPLMPWCCYDMWTTPYGPFALACREQQCRPACIMCVWPTSTVPAMPWGCLWHVEFHVNQCTHSLHSLASYVHQHTCREQQCRPACGACGSAPRRPHSPLCI
jgi:hypothetical protein